MHNQLGSVHLYIPMLDAMIKTKIDPFLNIIGSILFKLGISANKMTIIGFIFGLCGIFSITQQNYGLAALFIVLNRICDGLDGAIARHHCITDFGGYLDILCDFIIYSGIVFAFGIADSVNLLYSLMLIFSFIGPMTSFLAYAIIAGKRNITSSARGKKSFYYMGGICEGTETAFVLILACLIPNYFTLIAVIYSILCWMTTIGRTYICWQQFGKI